MAKGMYKEGAVEMFGGTDIYGNVRVKGTGEQIRDYLMMVGSDFPMNIWRAVKAQDEKYGYQPPTWESFRNYFNRLKQLELVVETEVALAPSTATKVQSGGYEKLAYRLNTPSGIDIEAAWKNPQAMCYRVLWGRARL